MAGLGNLTTQELMILSIFINVNGYENMSRQELERIFTAPSLYKPTLKSGLKSASKAKTKSTCKAKLKFTLKAEVKSKPKPKSTKTAPISIKIGELEKMKIAKIRPLAENTWYEWCDWLIKKIKGSFNDMYIE